MEIWSFETIHFLNYNTQRQIGHAVFIAINIYITFSLWAMELAE